eukprot:246158-Amorphochlora_amoeboformis.AAC.1
MRDSQTSSRRYSEISEIHRDSQRYETFTDRNRGYSRRYSEIFGDSQRLTDMSQTEIEDTHGDIPIFQRLTETRRDTITFTDRDSKYIHKDKRFEVREKREKRYLEKLKLRYSKREGVPKPGRHRRNRLRTYHSPSSLGISSLP